MCLATTDVWVSKAISVFGNRYTYGNAVYLGGKKPITITCRIHRDFTVSEAKYHLSGSGCKLCASVTNSRIAKQRARDIINKLAKEFVSSAERTHRNVYLYPNAKYTRSTHKIAIECRIHGEFWQIPKEHIRGQGCPKCARGIRDMCNAQLRELVVRQAADSFCDKANIIHKFKYDYSRVKYVTSSKKVEIICPNHGPFWQVPNSHLGGRGCRECAKNGFKPDKPAVIYLYQSTVHGSEVILYGITNNFKIRNKAHQTTFKYGGVEAKLLTTYNCSGYVAVIVEKEIKRSVDLYKNRLNGFKTECTLIHNLIKINLILEKHGFK